VNRLDMVAVGWGGLVCSIGLMAAAGRDLPLRLLATAASFLLGGFLAGVRASVRRPAHGLAAGVAGHVIYAVFVALASAIALFAEPDPPDLMPGGAARTGAAALWALAFALIGGLLAGSWLRPAGRRGGGGSSHRAPLEPPPRVE
jgi:peptidoglycan/LPS O-acetylase OafA/YrhL